MPRAGPLRLVLDKRETLHHAATLGIDTPQSWQPVKGDDFPARAAAAEQRSGQVTESRVAGDPF